MADTRTSTTMNINAVSNLVAALMSATGNPLVLPAELASGHPGARNAANASQHPAFEGIC
jgi:hypothetical protein